MVKSLPEHGVSWPPPRGDRDGTGWETRLQDRPASRCVGPLEKRAVANYQRLVRDLETRRAHDALSVRGLAARSGLSASVTSAALTGSAWPRWPTLTGLFGAVGTVLRLEGFSGEVITELFALIEGEADLTGASIAAELIVRRNTFYDLRRPGRAPSSATVLAFAAWFGLDVVSLEATSRSASDAR